MDPAYAILAATAATAIAFWANRHLLGFLPDDLPRPGRKAHSRPVPLAGIALLPVVLPWLLAAGRWWLAGAALAVAVLGYVDDWYKERQCDLDWRIKLPALLVITAAAATGVVDPWAHPARWCSACACVFVLTNATNFLDNTDGVAATVAGTGLLLSTGGNGPLAAAGFAALAFVPWNWPRPLLFLGDSGALLLGLCAGAACAEGLPAPSALLPFLVPFADFVQVVAARLYLGVPPWVGDRRHLTHIAQNLGLPRPLIAPLLALAVLGIAALGS